MPAQKPAPNDIVDPGAVARWALGLGATWFVLTLMADLGGTRDLAVAFAILIMSSVIIIHGEDAVRNLGFLGG